MMVTVSQSQTEIDALINSCLQRIATGPTMSKDLSRDEARLAMAAILAGKVDPVQTSVFLIALRMKPPPLRGRHQELLHWRSRNVHWQSHF